MDEKDKAAVQKLVEAWDEGDKKNIQECVDGLSVEAAQHVAFVVAKQENESLKYERKKLEERIVEMNKGLEVLKKVIEAMLGYFGYDK